MGTKSYTLVAAALLWACHAPPGPSPLCHSYTGRESCAPCDEESRISGPDARALAAQAHKALLEREVVDRTMFLAWVKPGNEWHEEYSKKEISERYFVSDAFAGFLPGYSPFSNTARDYYSVEYRLTTVGYSGRDRVHVRAEVVPYQEAQVLEGNRVSMFCITVRSDGADIRMIYTY